MAKEHILVVEDEEDILQLIVYNLVKEGFQVKGTPSGEEGLRHVRLDHPDLVILDLMLPGIDGFEVCRTIKADADLRRIPVIIVTAKGEETDIVTGLELGADDYIAKPFSPRVLIARVRAVLRRGVRRAVTEQEVIRRGDLTIHPGRHEVLVTGEPVDLTITEFRILLFLSSRPGWVFTRGQIVNAVHDENFAVTPRSIDVQIFGLRKKLGSKNYIETVRGVGYRFKD